MRTDGNLTSRFGSAVENWYNTMAVFTTELGQFNEIYVSYDKNPLTTDKYEPLFS